MKIIICACVALFALIGSASADPVSDWLDAAFRPTIARSTRVAHLPRHNAGTRRIRDVSGWTASYSGAPLVSVAIHDVGRRNWTGVSRWCVAGMKTWLRRLGYRAPASNRAIDVARYGRRSALVPGAIIVRRHHVSVYAGRDSSGRSIEISANGRGHRVHIGRRSLRGVVAVRAPV